MSAISRELKKAGESDYDYINDILFFKVKDREYAKSMEFVRFVIDFDKENFVVGIQIFDASQFFGFSKESLRNIRQWRFKANIEENRLELRLMFQTVYRNQLIEQRPIIMEQLARPLPDSRVVCNIA
ncbi:DUF2283 domain-containing protein [Candidatus Micrarchaeota archaeon]|nr:DUF2283 domain-containing protein [Candidatus Micrarchaeota archaeon]